MLVAGDTTIVNYFDKGFDRSQESVVELAPVTRQHAACFMYLCNNYCIAQRLMSSVYTLYIHLAQSHVESEPCSIAVINHSCK